MVSEEKPKKPKKKKGRGGRKQYWNILNMPDKLESVRGWCMQGSTDAEIMQMLGISRETFYKWKREKVEFADALKRGKDIANGELLNSAFRQSTGYYVPTMVVVKLKKPVLTEGDPILIGGQLVYDEEGKIVRKAGKVVYEEVAEEFPTEQYIAPNSTMNIFMLKNRLPDEYKDKKEINVTDTRFEEFMDDDDDEGDGL